MPYLVGAGMAAVALAEVLVRGDAQGVELALVCVLAVGTTAPVGWLQSHWLAPATVVAAATATLLIGHTLPIAGLAALLVTFYLVARHRSGRLATLLVAPLLALALVELTTSSSATTSAVSSTNPQVEEPPPEDPARDPDALDSYPILIAALAAGSAVVGYARRSRGTEAKLEDVEAAYTHDATAHAARGERVRIARELHDVVAHRITSIAVQAETARLTTPDLSPKGSQQLTEIGDSARDALAEMRRLLGVLRRDTHDVGERHPQPGIADIHQLVDDARRASGHTIQLTVRGVVEPLDPSLELTAYRVVQESLTNAQRHAPGAPVQVDVTFGSDVLRVRVRDTGGNQAAEPADGSRPGGRHGLVGMRERVEISGGTLTTGPAPHGGFLVEAKLPRQLTQASTPSPEDDDER
jgi:signal transduction histidine kinase